MINETLNLYLPTEVLDYTEGKRCLVVGGNKAMPDHERKLRKWFEFAQLEWVFCERGQGGPIQKAATAVMGGRYDMAILFVQFTSHMCEEILVPVLKANQVPTLKMRGGINPSHVALEIEKHLLRKAA